jgi:hypothetical protein
MAVPRCPPYHTLQNTHFPIALARQPGCRCFQPHPPAPLTPLSVPFNILYHVNPPLICLDVWCSRVEVAKARRGLFGGAAELTEDASGKAVAVARVQPPSCSLRFLRAHRNGAHTCIIPGIKRACIWLVSTRSQIIFSGESDLKHGVEALRSQAAAVWSSSSRSGLLYVGASVGEHPVAARRRSLHLAAARCSIKTTTALSSTLLRLLHTHQHNQTTNTRRPPPPRPTPSPPRSTPRSGAP